jgi:hypothetical protein
LLLPTAALGCNATRETERKAQVNSGDDVKSI